MSKDGKAGTRVQDQRVDFLQDSIRQAFPADAYSGKVTHADGEWTPELDDDQALYEGLNGRKWTEAPRQLIYDQPGGFELLTDQALTAFIPAWLTHSLEDMDSENEVRNYVVYSFSPNNDKLSGMSEYKLKRIQSLSVEQRLTIRSILAEFAKRGTDAFVSDLAARAVLLIDSLS